ncbi:uncharacterized protein [Pempheris klunzingeri]|uniref:uncharacterized protein isoform X2 n=1 Tax=Pempheris klunzingeri TaxID=3127111 RepID=UPI0039816090
MGTTGSRPRVRKVAPCNSLQEDGAQPKPQWTLPALPVSVEQPSGCLGQRKTILPPLKQELSLSTLSEPCFAGNLSPKQSNNSSIIHSHPPRRPQALQPLALQISHTSTANQIAMGRDCRDGVFQRFSTAGQTAHCGTGRMIQGGSLEAQTALAQQAHRHRRALHQQAREQRRHKVVYVVNGPHTERIQRVKLVRRPTERDIFWDETRGESLDPSCLLDPKALRHLSEEAQCNQLNKRLLGSGENGIELKIQRDQAQGLRHREKRTQQTEHRTGLSSNKNSSTTESESVRVEDRGKAQRDSWSWSRSGRSCQTGRITGVRGIWDSKLD